MSATSAAQHACGTVLLLVTVAGYDALLAGPGHHPALAGAVLTGQLTAIAVSRPRVRAALRGSRMWWAVVAATSPAAACAAVWWVLRPDGPSPSRTGTGQLANALAAGVTDLLQLNRPADVTADVLALPYAVTFVAAYLTALATSAESGVFTPVLPALAALALPVTLSAGEAPSTAVVVTGVGGPAVALVWLRTRHRGSVHQLGGRPVVRHVAVLAMAVVAGGIGVAAVAGSLERVPFDPQDAWPSDVAVRDGVSPLSQIKGELLAAPPVTRFVARVRTGSGPQSPVDRVVVARLDTYDGEQWTASADLRAAGSVLQRPTTAAEVVSAEFTVLALPGQLLPTMGTPLTLRVLRPGPPGIAFDRLSGAVVRVTPAGSTGEATGAVTYVQTGSTSPRARSDRLTAPERARMLSLPDGASEGLREAAARLAPGTGDPQRVLRGIESRLRDLPYSPQAPAGSSLAAVRRVLAGNSPANAGYAEQHAAAFAVLARALGLPSRVVVGYLLRARSAPDTFRVTSRDAHAWVEVFLDGRWTAFDPTDPARPPVRYPGAASPSGISAASPPADAMAPASVTPPDVPAPTVSAARTADARRIAARLARLLIPVAVLAVGAVAVVAIAGRAARWRRRFRRRRAASSAGRVIGAWQEAADRLRRRRVPVPASATPTESALAARAVVPGSAQTLTSLASLATAALFAPHEPGDDEVRLAWQLEAELRATLAAQHRHDLLDRLPRPLRAVGMGRSR